MKRKVYSKLRNWDFVTVPQNILECSFWLILGHIWSKLNSSPHLCGVEFGKSENLPFVGIKNTHTHNWCPLSLSIIILFVFPTSPPFSYISWILLYIFFYLVFPILLFIYDYYYYYYYYYFEASDTDIWLSGSESYLGSMRGSRRIRNLGS